MDGKKSILYKMKAIEIEENECFKKIKLPYEVWEDEGPFTPILKRAGE